jgi:hypothetical protein
MRIAAKPRSQLIAGLSGPGIHCPELKLLSGSSDPADSGGTIVAGDKIVRLIDVGLR